MNAPLECISMKGFEKFRHLPTVSKVSKGQRFVTSTENIETATYKYMGF